MKIVFVNHYGATPGDVGPTRNYEFAKRLSEKGNEVELWTCSYNHYTGKYNSGYWKGLWSLSNEQGVTVRRFFSVKYRKNLIMRQLNITIFSLLTCIYTLFFSKADIFVVTTPPLTILMLIAVKLRRKKFVLDVQDLWPEFLIDMGMKNKVVITIMKTLENLLYKYSDSIDTVSRGMEQYIQDKLINSNKKIIISPLGVNLSRYGLCVNEDCREYEWKDKFVVMYSGAHNPANNLENLVYACKHLDDNIAVVLFGDGSSKESLIKLKENLKLTNIYFENSVASFDVPKILSLSNVCITLLKDVPAFKKVRPNKLFEYMAAQKPIICGIDGEAADVVRAAASGILVLPPTAEKIAEAIEFLYQNNKHLNEMAYNGRKYIEKYGDRDKIIDEFHVFLSNTLSNNSRLE